jgi:hypothetical protein
MRLRMLTAIGLGLILTAIFVGTPANAETAPELPCGNTVSGPCTDTAHFDQVDQWLSPLGAGDNCPAYVVDDFALMVGTGNGIEHVNINKAGDFWATTTFTGQVSVAFYDPSNVVASVDDQGDVVSATVTGPADGVLSGHFTQWFGVSDNKQNGTFGQTFSFDGTDAQGNAIKLHGTMHETWTPGTETFSGPPHHAKFAVSCT